MCSLRPSLLVLLILAASTSVRGQTDAAQDPFNVPSDADPFGEPLAGDNGQAAANSGAPGMQPGGPSAPEKFGLAAGIGAPGGEPRMQYRGVATVAYAEQPLSPYGAAALGCGLGFVSPAWQSNYLGVSADFFQNAQACGRCITLQCDDQSCGQPGRQLPALVADVCGSCTGADLSISNPLFANLTGRGPGPNPSIVVSWDIISCAPLTQGTIKLLLKQGGSAFYQALNLSNAAQPIVAVKVNGQTLQRGSDNFWAWNPGQPIDPTAPLDVEVAGSNRQVLRARVPSLRNADLGVQFSAS